MMPIQVLGLWLRAIASLLIHGWTVNNDEGAYAKVELARENRVIVWDLPGLGNSSEFMASPRLMSNCVRGTARHAPINSHAQLTFAPVFAATPFPQPFSQSNGLLDR
jgi:hypothetical protein